MGELSQFFNAIVTVLFDILNYFNDIIKNVNISIISNNSYGFSIILLTLLIRVVLLPLSIKQVHSMQEMQKVQPKLKKLQEKYKKDKEKLQQEMMKFYSENKINPLGGCLPLLLQLPILWALFRMLLDNKELLEEAGFFWITNLSAPDPWYILIVLMIASTYYSQKMVTKDPSQMKMMLPMTVFLAIIAIRLPAGVMIYWVTTNIWQMAQQLITINLSKEQAEVK